MYKSSWLYSGLVYSLLFIVLPLAASADSCGSILDLSGATTAITACDNPFAVTHPNTHPSVVVAGVTYGNGSVVTIPGISTTEYIPLPPDNWGAFQIQAFKHISEGYEEVSVEPEERPFPTQAEQVILLEEYFSDDPDRDLFVTAFIRENVDTLTDAQQQRFSTFMDTVLFPLFESEVYPPLKVGTYTFVFTERKLCLSHHRDSSFFAQVLDWLVPVAYAQCGGERQVLATTITFTEAVTDPQYSSVLFLPGIQGSRLYVTEASGDETQLWEPNSLYEDTEIRRLAMDENGNSIESIYVDDVVDYVRGGDSIYGEFISFLESLQAEDTIVDYRVMPYDWRYDVYDVVANGIQYKSKTLYLDEIVRILAKNSATGKVTIVAHSNGGLLGKALIDTLKADGDVELIDTFITIGTPHLGAPQAIGSLLHGDQQGIAFDPVSAIPLFSLPVVSPEVVREAARNTAGAYGLLPGQRYFDETNDLIAFFDTGAGTQPFRDTFGNALNTQSELDSFLRDDPDLRTETSKLNEAIVLNEQILEKARTTRARLDTWQAPDTVRVMNVVGTGRNTVSGLYYRSFIESSCVSGFACIANNIYKPVPILTQRGDGTVPIESAGFGSDDDYYVDLIQIESDFDEFYAHGNLTELAAVQSLVRNTLLGATTSSDVLLETEPSYPGQQLLLGAHSPVYMYIVDASGRRTGQLSDSTFVHEIPQTAAFRFGDSVYIVTPRNTEYEVVIEAYDAGSVTVTVHDIAQQQTLRHQVPVFNMTSTTVITLRYRNDTFTPLSLDIDGDGQIDTRVPLTASTTSQQYSYQGLKESIVESALSSEEKRPILGLLTLAHRFQQKEDGWYFDHIEYRLLAQLHTLLNVYQEHSILSDIESQYVLEYVTSLQTSIF